MPRKPVARVGDIGSHGGTITSGSPKVKANGLPIARVGDIYNCPIHGPNPIVSGAPTVFGPDRLVAHIGSKTACGAIITSGSPDTFVDDPVPASSAEAVCVGWGNYSEQFCLINDFNGEPLSGVAYRIQTQSGLLHEGITDAEGKTVRIYTKEAEEIECVLV